jgi:hypothetical protein
VFRLQPPCLTFRISEVILWRVNSKYYLGIFTNRLRLSSGKFTINYVLGRIRRQAGTVCLNFSFVVCLETEQLTVSLTSGIAKEDPSNSRPSCQSSFYISVLQMSLECCRISERVISDIPQKYIKNFQPENWCELRSLHSRVAENSGVLGFFCLMSRE